ncbi:MAG TPA: tetratricopeptide repeat protein [Victivallales bacterium]|nr:tetratricopeptide repeat protein [Victivallales bacterium]
MKISYKYNATGKPARLWYFLFLGFISYISLTIYAVDPENLSPNAEKLFKLGNSFFYGKDGKEKNYSEAFKAFEKAAQIGHKGALFNLGICFDRGMGIEKDPFKAYACYLEAAAGGIKEAKYNLAVCLIRGVSARDGSKAVEPDLEMAESELEKLVSEGYKPAFLKLAELRMSLGGEKANKAYPLLKEIENENSPLILRMLADCLYLGIGCDKDVLKAMKLLERASDLGDPEASAKLAHLFYNGKDTPKDVARAVELFKKAANKKEPMALYVLGNMFLTGENVKQDIKEARKCFEISAASGNPRAIFSLGVLAKEGIGETPDSLKAARLFLSAAKLGDARSQFNLGVIYKNSDGFPKDIPASVFWFRKAAEQGDERAQIEMVKFFLDGENRDLVSKEEADKYLKLAADKGNKDAINIMNNLDVNKIR